MHCARLDWVKRKLNRASINKEAFSAASVIGCLRTGVSSQPESHRARVLADFPVVQMYQEVMNADNRLGAVMVRLGLAGNKDVDKALSTVSSARLPLGKVLLLQEKLTPPVLRLAIDAQWLLKEELISEENAFESVHIGRRNNWTLSDVLLSMGLDANPERSVRLGELLVESGWLSNHERLKYLQLASATGLPLGRVLIALDKLGVGIIRHAVGLQHSVRNKEIDRDHAISLLQSISEQLECKEFRLGELLIAAKQARKQEIQVAIEMSQSSQKYTGEVMIEMGWLEEGILDRAIKVQMLLRQNRVDYDRAIALLGTELADENTDSVLDQAVAEETFQITLYDFLKLIGYFQKGKLEDLVHRLAGNPKLLRELVGTENDKNLKDQIKDVIDDSASLKRALSFFYPQDTSNIEHGMNIVRQINSSLCSLEKGMIDFASYRQLPENG